MQFGLCCDLGNVSVAAEAGADYGEWTVDGMLLPNASDEAFQDVLASLRSAPLSFPVVRGFVPANLKVTGSDVDTTVLKAYAEKTLKRAEQAGVDTIVWGSGKSRRVPEGFDPQRAYEQLVTFGRMVGTAAAKHGVTVVVEPLSRGDCNIINTVEDGARLVEDVGHPNVRLLVDAYHFMHNGDSYVSIVNHGKLFAHVHVATFPGRLAPGSEACDFGPFFSALGQIPYNGRVSVEAIFKNVAEEFPRAISVLRDLGQA